MIKAYELLNELLIYVARQYRELRKYSSRIVLTATNVFVLSLIITTLTGCGVTETANEDEKDDPPPPTPIVQNVYAIETIGDPSGSIDITSNIIYADIRKLSAIKFKIETNCPDRLRDATYSPNYAADRPATAIVSGNFMINTNIGPYFGFGRNLIWLTIHYTTGETFNKSYYLCTT